MKNSSRNKIKSRSSFAKKPSSGKQKGITKQRPGMKRAGKKNERFKGKSSGKKPFATKKTSAFLEKQKRVTHKQQNNMKKQQKHEKGHISKLIIQEQLKKSSPDIEKIKTHLTQLKSRGYKQRVKAKLAKQKINLD